MDVGRAHRLLTTALEAQNFRPVDLGTLAAPAAINLAAVPADLSQALAGVQRTQTDWMSIGGQLAVLREGLNQQGPYLSNVYIGAQARALKVVVAVGYGGTQPVQEAWFKKQFDFTWTIIQSLQSHIQQFDLSPQLLALLDAVRQKYLASTDPVVSAAVDLAWSYVSTSKAEGGPRAAFVAVCSAGVSDRLGAHLRSYGYAPQKSTAFGVPPNLEGLAWDSSPPAFANDQLYFGVLNAINDTQLKTALAL